jgi:anhydro-N-acetylmuramic acid kinase
LIVAGIMSGTSADGVDVALVRLRGRGLRTGFELLGHGSCRYPAAVRSAVLEAMNSPAIPVAQLARLNFLLAEIYASCVRRVERRVGVSAELAGCHGQTIYHQGEPADFLGRRIACTWQIGDGSVLAARLGIPVVSDFRPADMAAGGLGAPLVPYLDLLVFRHPKRGRIVQNIGGIGNLTAIPAGASPSDVVAFDTGPGNMLIDALSEQLFGLPFDSGGRLAAKGNVLEPVVSAALKEPFFRRLHRAPGPRTAGREQFGREYTARFLDSCAGVGKHDILATATAVTARSIGEAVRRLARQHRYHDLFLSGGGARNRTLVAGIRREVAPLGIEVSLTDAAGIPSQAKEAIAFALLAYQSWLGEASSLPGATGARRAARLGKISHA